MASSSTGAQGPSLVYERQELLVSLDSPPIGRRRPTAPVALVSSSELPLFSDVQLAALKRRGEVVCYVQTPDPNRRGSGFLASPLVFVTNNHVIGSIEEAELCLLWIFSTVSKNADGEYTVKLIPLRLDPHTFFFTSALRKGQNSAGEDIIFPAERGYLDITACAIAPTAYPFKLPQSSFLSLFHTPQLAVSSPICVIQCPHVLTPPSVDPNQPLRSIPVEDDAKMSFGALREVAPPVVLHDATTSGGASGAPLLTRFGELVGVHHQSVAGGLREAILVTEIAAALLPYMEKLQPLLDTIYRAPITRGINGVPFLDSSFTARDEGLAELDQRLSENRIVAVSGLGGVGKSSLAVKYAYYHAQYDHVLHLTSDTQGNIDRGLSALATALDIPDGNIQFRFDLLKQRIATLKRTFLIVVDDLRDTAQLDYINQIIPGADHIKLLITSCLDTPLVRKGVNILRLGPFDERAAVSYLLKAMPGKDEEKDQAIRLANELGRLPLALKQAIAYIQMKSQTEDPSYSFGHFADEIQRAGVELLAGLEESEQTVFKTWERSRQAILRLPNGHHAIGVLDLFSVLANTPLPIEELKKLRAVTDEFSLEMAVERLRSYSLIEKAPKGYVMHSLLQKVIKFTSEDSPQMHLLRALKLFYEMSKDWNPKDYRVRRKLEVYVPHLEVFVHGVKNMIDESHLEALGAVVGILWSYYCNNGQFERSRQLAEEYLKIQEGRKEETLRLVENLVRLGSSLWKLGRYAEASVHQERALKLIKKLPSEKERLANLYNDLAGTVLHLHEYDHAVNYQKKALAIYRKANNQKQLAMVYNNLGCSAGRRRKIEEAIYFHKRALDIRKSLSNDEDPLLAMSYDNLARAVTASMDHQASVGLRKLSKLFPKTPPDFDRPADKEAWNFATTLGRRKEALEYHNKALKIRLDCLGEEHPSIADSYFGLGQTLLVVGNYDEALKYLQHAFQLRKKLFGGSHPDTIMSENAIVDAANARKTMSRISKGKFDAQLYHLNLCSMMYSNR